MNKFLLNKKILILGGSGFIGTNLLILLRKKGYKNITATYFTKKNFFKVKGVKYSKSDLRVSKNVDNLTKTADIVFMLAAVSSGAKIIEKNPLEHFSPNVRLNLDAIEKSYNNNVKKFIFVSSNTVYPDTKKSMAEKDINYQLFSKYYIVGWMKIFSEIVCNIYANKIYNKKMDILIVRPSNLYGPFDKFSYSKSKVVAALIRKFHERKIPIEIWGDGQDLKDFLYIEDFCESLIKVASHKKHFEIINICSGKSIKIQNIINILIKKFNIKNKDIYNNLDQPSMIPIRLMSNKSLIKNYKIKHRFDILKGLEKTVEWYKKNYTIYNRF